MKDTPATIPMPRWYQDLSIPQMQNVFSLGDIIRADYDERVTERTRRALGDIGVTSTFVKITPEQIKKSRRLTDLDPVKFLCEIYRIVTGNYFTDEQYKKVYDCNERIILSAIAFLTLPETVIELHQRIPMGETPKLPPKPVPHKIEPRQHAESPYLEPLFTRPDWLNYAKELYLWRKKREKTPFPKAILPPLSQYSRINEVASSEKNEKNDNGDEEKLESYQQEITDKDEYNSSRASSVETNIQDDHENVKIDKTRERIHEMPRGQAESGQRSGPNIAFQKNKSQDKIGSRNKLAKSQTESVQFSKPNIGNRENKINDKIEAGNKRTRSQTEPGQLSRSSVVSQGKNIHDKIRERKKLSKEASFKRQENQFYDKIGGRNGERKEKVDYSSQQHSKSKACLGEKDTHLIVSGIIENDDLSEYPISYGTSGLAYVTPENSDESFFAALNLDDTKKEYPRGRENLSRKCQEWISEMDEEFMKVEKQANEIIKSFEETLKLMGPEPTCDGCCSCRQTRKSNMKYHRTKTPQIVIDSITMDGKQNKYVVGSLVMNSPGASPSESTADLPDVIASHDNIIKNKIISCVVNENGETNYYIDGYNKEIEHVPRKIISSTKLPKPIKNVPPCGCAIEKFINEGLTDVTSDDNIPWTKKDQPCIGRKYRSGEIGSSSCRDYPNDKTCRRNPFKKKIDEQIRAKLREKENSGKDNYPPKEKNMYSMAEFQPCGDEDGMAICGGPWGAVNIPDEEELARREAEAKLIRESPPCGDKPGRAICGAPFGSRHPIPKKPKRDDDDEDEEDEEPDEEELEEIRKRKLEARKTKVREPKIEKLFNRDDHCDTVAQKNGGISESSTGPESKMKQYRMARLARKNKNRKTLSENKTGSDGDFERKSKSNTNNVVLGNDKSLSGVNASEENMEDRERREKEKIIMKNKTKKLKDQWNRSKIMSNKLLVSPPIIPKDPPSVCKREVLRDCHDDDEKLPEDESTQKEGPFGRKTKSEEALPIEKTLVYLVNPEKPVETIAVRPGGRPCKCRENRNAKKTLLYNVAGTIKEGKGKRDQKISHVIDGLIYITPTPSVRNSEEYIPEYELYDSPYEKCTRERKNDDFNYVEKYLGPKSLMMKQPRSSIGCKCSSMKEEIVDSSRQEEINNDGCLVVKEVALPEKKKWSRARENEGLIDFYARCRDNVPCWLRCVEFSNDGCCVSPRVLQVKRPVCECKYERKIVKRDEERKNWLNRQERLKSYKKQHYGHVEGVYAPMETETKLIISDVKKISTKDTSNDHLKYGVAGVTQERVMRPPEGILAGIGMHTPITTPEPSKPDIPIPKEHRHWSPMDIRGTSTISGNKQSSQLRKSAETHRRDKIGDKNDQGIDVLFESDQVATNHSKMKDFDFQADKSLGRDKSRSTGKYNVNRGTGKDNMSKEKDTNRGRGENDVNRSRAKHDMNRSKEKHVNRDREKDDINRGSEKYDMNQSRENDVMKQSREKSAMRHSRQTDESQKQRSISPVQQPYELKAAELAGTESSKTFLGKDSGTANTSIVHTSKSTGNIISQEKDAIHPDDKKKESPMKTDMKQLLRIELKKMAEEGFLFAQLPECHQMPQLQYWIMYRKGIAFSAEAKRKLMDRSLKIWKSVEKQKAKKIEAPTLEISKKILENLSYDKVDEIKRQVALKRELFYSNLRKSRVLQARTMWGLMEFGKFPGVSFKRAFFTYQPAKESDGFVFKPWQKQNTQKGKKT